MKCVQCASEITQGQRICPVCGSFPTGDSARFGELKKVFSHRYDFIRLLGAGGFADVYLAKDKLLERDVAIKILLPQHGRDAQIVERFLREARLYAKLEHKNIIPIFDTGILEEHVFITMKYVAGESLKQLLLRQAQISFRSLPGIIRDIASALSYIHQQGIVHRDIKPANIIVEKNSQIAYLADFGIARSASSQTMTQTGMIVGTPHYLSPEQINGKKPDMRSDIYSLGTTLYELASGRPPFAGDTPLEILYQHINRTPEPLVNIAPAVPAYIQSLIMRCVEKNPAHRFQNAGEILAALDRPATPGSSQFEKTVATAANHRRQGKTKKLLAGFAVLAGLAAAATIFWMTISPRSPIHSKNPMPRPASHTQAEQNKTTVPLAFNKSQTDDQAGSAQSEKPPAQDVVIQAEDISKPAAGTQPRELPGRQKTSPPLPRPTPASAPPGIVRFSSFPSLAEVFLHGEKIGGTEQWFEKKLPAGEYTFTFSIAGFQSAEVKATVRSGETISVHHRFPLFRSFTITARPFGRIAIDGRDFGDTPQTIKLAFGKHWIKISKPGYKAEERQIAVDHESKNSVFFELVKEDK